MDPPSAPPTPGGKLSLTTLLLAKKRHSMPCGAPPSPVSPGAASTTSTTTTSGTLLDNAVASRQNSRFSLMPGMGRKTTLALASVTTGSSNNNSNGGGGTTATTEATPVKNTKRFSFIPGMANTKTSPSTSATTGSSSSININGTTTTTTTEVTATPKNTNRFSLLPAIRSRYSLIIARPSTPPGPDDVAAAADAAHMSTIMRNIDVRARILGEEDEFIQAMQRQRLEAEEPARKMLDEKWERWERSCEKVDEVASFDVARERYVRAAGYWPRRLMEAREERKVVAREVRKSMDIERMEQVEEDNRAWWDEQHMILLAEKYRIWQAERQHMNVYNDVEDDEYEDVLVVDDEESEEATRGGREYRRPR